MKKDDAWFIPLILLFVLNIALPGHLWLRIALALNAIIVLIDVVIRGWRILHDKKSV